MQSIKVWHPDVMDFIECKWKEEQKAHALIREGYESNFNGEAYSSVMFQNANLSVRLTDEFMQAVRDDQVWSTRWISDKPKEAPPKYRAREVLNRMAECAWNCGDPGVQYDTTINQWHTCPNSGRINASNPCSEYMFLDNTACNLSSINLMKFRRADGSFDDRQDRLQQPPVPSAWARLLQPWLVDHDQWGFLRFPDGPWLVRLDHRIAPWSGQSGQRRDGRCRRSLCRVSREFRTDDARHANASQRR
jgi:ribonucleotide reductase alpha subunit